MVKADFVFNVIVYTLVICYILFINFSAYYNKSSGFLSNVTSLFNNWIFRAIFLLIVGIFALDLFPYGGFILAVLLTIAFLNTTMLIYKKNITEKFSEHILDLNDNVESFEGEDMMESFEGEDMVESYENEDMQESFEGEDMVESYENEDEDGQENYENEDEDGQENYENEDEDEDEDGQENFGGSYEYDSMNTGEYSEQFSNCQRKESFSSCQGRESFANQYDLQSPQNCGPYAPLQRLPFNPQGYRPDDTVLGSGAPDALPSDSLANGEYTTSGIGYEFNMA